MTRSPRPARGVPRRPHPLLLDWLEAERSAGRRPRRALVIGSGAEAGAVAKWNAVTRLVSAGDLPRQGPVFDLVVVVQTPTGDAAQLARLADSVADPGTLVIIASSDAGCAPPDLAVFAVPGLRLVDFEELTAATPGAGPGTPGRCLRIVFERDGD